MRGKHRPDFKGGSGRSEQEIFLNDFQGKLGEIAVRKEIEDKWPYAVFEGDIDFQDYDRGVWDNYDLKVNGKYLSIKTVKHFSIVLMIDKLYNY
ncbi:hypothetical protein [Clostridium polynesiense]|uniref:hypothetical protein n=1 Tax=Clostridium polynesiense TaxID=1325933 RepID=UPI00058B2697|nr:hypothetical protein [Clostridium polynesiense]